MPCEIYNERVSLSGYNIIYVLIIVTLDYSDDFQRGRGLTIDDDAFKTLFKRLRVRGGGGVGWGDLNDTFVQTMIARDIFLDRCIFFFSFFFSHFFFFIYFSLRSKNFLRRSRKRLKSRNFVYTSRICCVIMS